MTEKRKNSQNKNSQTYKQCKHYRYTENFHLPAILHLYTGWSKK